MNSSIRLKAVGGHSAICFFKYRPRFPSGRHPSFGMHKDYNGRFFVLLSESQNFLTIHQFDLSHLIGSRYIKLYFTRAMNQYITGTMIKVRNVAKVSPKMMAHDIGFQKMLLSPPT
jgi:hypothetical protein